MQDEEEPTEEEQAIIVPAEATPPEPEVEEEEEDELADLFEVPQPEDNDMRTDHLLKVEEEDDMSDLVEVSEEDVMGEAPEPEQPEPEERPVAKSKKYRIVRPIRREPPPTSLGGIR